MQLKKFYYHNLGYWFLLFIALAFAGFYKTYFSRLLEPIPDLIHIHFVLMGLWIGMLITQPFLIKYKKLSWHRMLGKISYVLVPLILISAFLLTRREYYQKIDTLRQGAIKGLNHLSQFEIVKAAATNPAAILTCILFALFYFLAIWHRHKSNKHARYMLATALLIVGPTLDRIIFLDLNIRSVAGISAYFISFLLVDIILSLLLYLDFKNKRGTKTLTTCLLIFITAQLSFYILPQFNWWAAFMKIIMLPKL